MTDNSSPNKKPDQPNSEQSSDPADDAFEIDDLELDDLELDDLPDPDNLEDWEDGSPNQSDISLETLLQKLIQDAALPPNQELYALSDLTRAETAELRNQWAMIPVERRRKLVSTLIKNALEDLDLLLGRFLRVAMDDDDPQVRILAIQGLWEDGDSDLLGPLIQKMHNDPDVDVRSAAAASLGNFVLEGELDELPPALSMRAEEALLAVLHDETQPLAVRCRALESMAYSGETGVRELIEDAYYSQYEDMRLSALSAMGRSADIRWRGLARAELQNPSPKMRVEAALACGELEAESALGDLLELLTDLEQDVRLAAIFALGRIGGRTARDALETMATSEDPVESQAAQDALEEMLFYAAADSVSLYDEPEEEEEWDVEPWDSSWYDMDDRDLGSYE